jgi:hypothetical protein
MICLRFSGGLVASRNYRSQLDLAFRFRGTFLFSAASRMLPWSDLRSFPKLKERSLWRRARWRWRSTFARSKKRRGMAFRGVRLRCIVAGWHHEFE